MFGEYDFEVGYERMRCLVEWDFPGFGIVEDNNLSFFNHDTEDILSGRKTMAIRFAKPTDRRLIRIPTARVLPWLETSLENPYDGQQIGVIYIRQIVVASVRDFPAVWVKPDPYPSKKAMLEDIGATYKHILRPSDVLSMYWIEPR